MEEHCSDGQETVKCNLSDDLRIRKDLLVEESDYKSRTEPVLLLD